MSSTADVKLYTTGPLGLPAELLSAIALLLEHRDILHLSMACRRTQSVYRASKELQYLVDLGRHGYVDGSPECPLSISERHDLLLSRRSAWKRAVPYLRRPHPSADQSYLLDLAGGVYAHYAVSRNPQLVLHSLPSRVSEERLIEVPKLDVPLDNLAIDPSQDLLAFVEGHIDPDDPLMEEGLVGSDVNGRVTLHLRRLSSSDVAVHSNAFLPTLTVQCAHAFLTGSSLHIAGSSIALFSSFPNPLLVVWNWISGERLIFMSHSDFTIQCSGFTFLSTSAFTLTEAHPQLASTLLVPFDPNGKTKLNPKEIIRQSIRLLFPTPSDDHNILYLTVGTSPLGRPEPRRQVFTVSPGVRLHAFIMKVVHGDVDRPEGSPLLDTAVMIIVKTSTLLSWLYSATHSSKQIRWADWGPGNVRIIEQGETSHLSDVAFSGSRLTFGVQYASSHDNPEGNITHYIFDFNTSQQDGDLSAPMEIFDDPQSIALSRRFIGSEESAFSMGLQPETGTLDWTNEVLTRQLPCFCTRLKDDFVGEEDDVLLDDMYIVKSVYMSDSHEEHSPTTIYAF
ncbi:hypothetical protein PENSPDRAFT_760107 [Peniophora sp. CONT]|nr:hypothetical protein PENSPDRAFT_760107 [Peniophora sp. CONT]